MFHHLTYIYILPSLGYKLHKGRNSIYHVSHTFSQHLMQCLAYNRYSNICWMNNEQRAQNKSSQIGLLIGNLGEKKKYLC